MEKFCGLCGGKVNPNTGVCTSCGSSTREPSNGATKNDTNTVNSTTPSAPLGGTSFGQDSNKMANDARQKEMEKYIAEQQQLYLKQKEEKKQAWEKAKKCYEADVAEKKRLAKIKKSSASVKKTGRVAIKVTALVLILAMLGAGIFFGVNAIIGGGDTQVSDSKDDKDKKEDKDNEAVNSPLPDDEIEYNPPTEDNSDDYMLTAPDADEYYEENSNILWTEYGDSNSGSTEKDAYEEFSDRGFTQAPITSNYTASGEYYLPQEISSDGSERHPMYSTSYTTESGYTWVINEINGIYTAIPVSYNLTSNNVVVMISEDESLMSYDSTLNKFYKTIPNEDVVDVKVVDRIDARTLENLTESEINDL